MKPFIISLVLCLFLSACNQSSKEAYHDIAAPEIMSEEVMADQTTRTSSLPSENTVNTDLVNKKIIKEGRIGIQVTDLKKTKQNIDIAITQNKGYYANESFQDTNYESHYHLRIRIPSVNYERFISEIETGNGKILYKEIGARDVTDQFVDIETRLSNKRNYLNRYRELVKQAKTIKEVLEVEEQIRVLEEEIESAEGRLRLMSDQITYSTLDLTLTKENEYIYTPEKRDRFPEKVKEAFSTGWYTFVDVILVIFAVWPLWLILGVIVFVIRRKNKKNKK